MVRLDSVPGAGVLVDGDHTIVDVNVRAEIVFREDADRLRGTPLGALTEWGLCSQADLETWRDQVDSVISGTAESATDQITFAPEGSDDEYVYELRMRAETDPSADGRRASCSFRSVGTSARYEETVTALHEATRQLMTAEDTESVLRQTAVAAHEVLGFPGTSVRQYDPEAELLRHIAFGARINNIETRPPFPVDDSPHGRAFRQGETVIDEIDDEDPFDRDAFTQAMYIPIGETGTLSIGTVGNRFDEIDVQFGEILAENAAAAIRAVDTKASLRRERERLDQFASVVSHDLRNPLEIARMYLDLARDSGDPDDFEAARDALDRMDQMIDDLLTMARADEKLNRLDAIDLDRLVTESWRNVATGDAALVSTLPEETTVPADPNLLQNVFENLFRNAVEHGSTSPRSHAPGDAGSEASEPPVADAPGDAVEHGVSDGSPTARDTAADGDASVTVTVGLLDGDRGFYVADDGPGIPPDQREDVFDHGYTTATRGTGFGLSIVETLIEAHGWTVSVTESESGGARFEIRFGVVPTSE